MTRARRTFAIVAALATLAALAAAAAPVSAGPKANPQAEFEAAQRRFDKKDFAGALPAFEDALRASGSPNARLYVARCLAGLGRLPEAWEAMRQTAREAEARAQKEPRFVETRDAATRELADLEKRIARVVIRVDAPADGLQVTLADAPVAAARFGDPIAVSPGAVVVRASAPGRSPFSREVRADAGASVEVAVVVEVPRATSAPPPPPPPPPHGGTVRKVGFGVLAIGVAGGAVFGVGGMMARSKFNTVKDECGGKRCTDPKYNAIIDSGRTATTIANVGLVAGAVGLAGGTAMIVFGGPKAPRRDTRASGGLWLDASPLGATLGYGGQF